MSTTPTPVDNFDLLAKATQAVTTDYKTLLTDFNSLVTANKALNGDNTSLAAANQKLTGQLADAQQALTLSQSALTVAKQSALDIYHRWIHPDSIRGLFGPTFRGKLMFHDELWFTKGGKHPIDTKDPVRQFGWDQQVPADVLAHLRAQRALGADGANFNAYAIGTNEDKALLIYFSLLAEAGMQGCVNGDGAIWEAATTTADAFAAIEKYYLTRVRPLFSNANYIKMGGKPLFTVFPKDGKDTPAMWAQLAAKYPDTLFMGNIRTADVMAWGPAQDISYYQTMAAKALADTAHQYLLSIGIGFNDRNSITGMRCWDSSLPARICPSPAGPTLQTLKDRIAVIVDAIAKGLNPEWVQVITDNDRDEGSGIGATKFAPSPWVANEKP